MNAFRTIRCVGTLLALVTLWNGCSQPNLDDYQVLDEASAPKVNATSNGEGPDAEARMVDESGLSTGQDDSTQSSAATDPAVGPETVEQSTDSADEQSNLLVGETSGNPSTTAASSAGQPAGAGPVTTGSSSAPSLSLAATPSSAAAGSIPGLKREIKLLIPDKVFVPEGKEGALRVSFDDIDLLKVLNMDPVPPSVMDHLPDWLKALDGQKVRLRGWMYPPASERGITRFMFVRDNGICCFGRLPLVYDKVAVTLKEGRQTDYIQGHAFDVVGTFVIDADVDEGEVMWLYAMDDAIVINQ